MKGTTGILLTACFVISCNSGAQSSNKQPEKAENMFKIKKSENEWKQELTAEQYNILRQCGTEPPGTGKYYNFYKNGKYICAACGQELFDSKTKYSSGSGWSSFYDVVADSNVVLIEDRSAGMIRTEVRCAKCGGHLGHVFPDGPEPTKLRYCINSEAMVFVEKDKK